MSNLKSDKDHTLDARCLYAPGVAFERQRTGDPMLAHQQVFHRECCRAHRRAVLDAKINGAPEPPHRCQGSFALAYYARN